MSTGLKEKVDFTLIRYANCWEDADILLEGLSPVAGSKILSIGSAGDNSFSLLTSSPEVVVATDINKIQLYLIELKKAVIKKLAREEALEFMGFESSAKRIQTFHLIKNEMSHDAIRYWEENQHLIELGIIYSGKFEKYFQLFSKKILPWIHSQKRIEELFKIKTENVQHAFYNKQWNTWRWKLLFKIFFSKYIMGKYGRDPQFLKEVDVPVANFIYNKAAIHLQSTEAQQNFMLHFSLRGDFGSLLPHFMRAGNYELIKSNIESLKLNEGYTEDAIKAHGGDFKYMNLSNIFEYMNTINFINTSKQLIRSTQSGGKIAYWNLMTKRRISEIFPKEMQYEKELSIQLSKKDKGFFYDQFIVDTKI